MYKTHYRLKTSTMAILTLDGRKVAVTIPFGSTVEVIAPEINESGWWMSAEKAKRS